MIKNETVMWGKPLVVMNDFFSWMRVFFLLFFGGDDLDFISLQSWNVAFSK